MARRPKMVHSFRAAVAAARRHGDLYFAALLSEDHIEKAFGTARWLWQGWIYTPAVTVWVFLSQCLSPDHSCRDAVARLIAWRVARGQKPCSAETGGGMSLSSRWNSGRPSPAKRKADERSTPPEGAKTNASRFSISATSVKLGSSRRKMALIPEPAASSLGAAPVPEPGALALLVAGAASLAIYRKRR